MTDATTDIVCPFLIDSGLTRGQAVRLQKTLDTIISQHNYPEPIGILIAQSALLTALLASIIKFDSVFTLQIQGSGPVSMLAVDMTADGKMRGYSRFDESAVNKAYEDIQEKNADFVPAFFKEGTLSFHVETNDQSYQGITALDQPTLADCVLAYFRQSEQIATALKIEVDPPSQTGKGWIGSALMLQRLPVDKNFPNRFRKTKSTIYGKQPSFCCIPPQKKRCWMKNFLLKNYYIVCITQIIYTFLSKRRYNLVADVQKTR